MNTRQRIHPAVTQDEYLADRAKAMTEAELQRCVEQAAHLHGWLTYHTHDSRRSQPGFPDLVLVRDTRVLYRELKTTTGRLRPDQTRWLTALQNAGQDAIIWRPIDWLHGAITADLSTPGTNTTTDLTETTSETQA